MDIYELVNEMDVSKHNHHWINLYYSFNSLNRSKLEDAYDLEVFDLIAKTYGVYISYRSRRGDGGVKKESGRYDGERLEQFNDEELKLLDELEWTRLPHDLKAHVYDVIWLCNQKYEAVLIAAEEYYKLYKKCFDEVNWVQCVDYISRAVELLASIRRIDKKEELLTEVYDDVIRLNGEDTSFLSISLIELMIEQDYSCDYNSLIPLVNRLIANNEYGISTSYIVEQAYYVKANLYKKMKDAKSENKVYIQYAESLLRNVESLINGSNEAESTEDRKWFMIENDIKKAIELFQNHGDSKKANKAQKLLIEVQRVAVKHMQLHKAEYDVSAFYKEFESKYKNHSVQELIWDVVFAFGFQNKQKIREEVINNEFPIASLFPMQRIGSEGQTDFCLPSLDLDDEDNILLHMYSKAREYEEMQGQTFGVWFIQLFKKLKLQEEDLDCIFEENPIIPNGQEKDVQRGVYYGLTGQMSDALDKLAPKMENTIRNIAESCGDLMTYYCPNDGVQQKRPLSQVFVGEKLNECVDENILFTFDGLLQQKAGSNIRNRIGHGLNSEAECTAGDCIYFVMIVLKFCAMYSSSYIEEYDRRIIERVSGDRN